MSAAPAFGDGARTHPNMRQFASRKWQLGVGYALDIAAGRSASGCSIAKHGLMEITRPDSLRDIAQLSLTLSEVKQLLANFQQAVIAAQADRHATLRPDCQSCGGPCGVRDWRLHRIATLFGG